MKERKTYHCDRCDRAAEKTAFAALNYQGRIIDLCPSCAEKIDQFLREGHEERYSSAPFLPGGNHES